AAYLFTERGNDIVQDIVENRRVMLIGHTGSGKTSFIEQVAARHCYSEAARLDTPQAGVTGRIAQAIEDRRVFAQLARAFPG
ncbi:hypothetical protein AB4Y38_43450, partial [Paraburkholderia sp. EG285A]